MASLQAVYYRAPDGSEPVNDFIDRLTVKRQVALDNQIDRLNMLTASGPHLPFPHSSQIEGELRELRCHFGRGLYRILYRRSRNLIVLLHIFRKDTGPGPEGRDRGRQGALEGLPGPYGCPEAPSPAGGGPRRTLSPT